MRKTKNDTEQTIKLLLDTAYDLFVKNGYESTTISQISSQAKLTRGAVYWHFKNKEEIFICVIKKLLKEQNEKKNYYFTNNNMSIKEKLVSIISLPLEMKDSYKLVNTVPDLAKRIDEFKEVNNLLRERKSSLKKFFEEFLFEYQQKGKLKINGQVNTCALMLFILFEGMYYSSMEDENIKSSDISKFVDMIIDFI